MTDKWTIDFTSDQIGELVRAAEDQLNNMKDLPPADGQANYVYEMFADSVRYLEEALEILIPVLRKINDEARVPE